MWEFFFLFHFLFFQFEPEAEHFEFDIDFVNPGTDGCYFGTTFPHMFFLEFPELKPSPPEERYIPKVFGFKVHETSYAKSLEAKMKAKSKE